MTLNVVERARGSRSRIEHGFCGIMIRIIRVYKQYRFGELFKKSTRILRNVKFRTHIYRISTQLVEINACFIAFGFDDYTARIPGNVYILREYIFTRIQCD